jgi:two-component system sensor histidine kinase/response regulator
MSGAGARDLGTAPGPERVTAPVKILIVDDLEQNLRSLEALLRGDDVQILQARSGREALELLLVHDVALALLDVQMPDMDGFELAELLRGSLRTRDVPLIFVTAGARDQLRVFQGYDAGAVDFLYKPIEPTILRHKTQVFLRLYRQRRQLSAQLDALRASAEERERLVGELTESLRLAEMFTAVLGHDLRNPLSVITTSADTLVRRAVDDNVRRPAARIMANGQRMGRMIDELLDLARARDAGGIPLSLGDSDLFSLCRKVVADHEVAHPARGLELRHEGDAQGVWDEDRLFQVLSNLLANALEHGTPDAPVSLTIDANRPEEVVIAVRNAGVIPPAIMPHLFDPFRVRQERLNRTRGLGLGLYIVRHIVEAHGGTVTVSSSEESGTAFVVKLPRVAVPSAPPPAAAPPAR